MKYKIFTAATLLIFCAPVVTFAQQYFGQVDTFFTRIGGFIDNILIPLIFTLSLLMFVYGVFNYFFVQGDSETARDTGRKYILWGILGFVVMVSVWGIVNIIATGLFGTTTPPTIPGTPTL